MTHFSSFRRLGSLISLLGLSGFVLLGGACSDAGTPDENVGSAEAALTAEQCEYFDINGTVQICHELGNGKFKILRLAEQACIHAHSEHAGDYVTSTDPSSPLYDPTCQGNGCLPENAPCDETLPCCDGSTCEDGTCQAANLCSEPCPLPAWADDECTVSACDPGTGVCGPLDFWAHYKDLCNGGTGVCQGGVCHLDLCLASPCMNDGQCFSTYGSGTYFCACPSGYAGTNCEEVVPVVTCPCSGDPTWEETLTAGAPTEYSSDAANASGAYTIDGVYRTAEAYNSEWGRNCAARKYDGNTLVSSVNHSSLSVAEAEACYSIVSAWVSTAP